MFLLRDGIRGKDLGLKQYRNYKCSKMDEVFWVGKSDTFMLTQQIGKKVEPLNQAKEQSSEQRQHSLTKPCLYQLCKFKGSLVKLCHNVL